VEAAVSLRIDQPAIFTVASDLMKMAIIGVDGATSDVAVLLFGTMPGATM